MTLGNKDIEFDVSVRKNEDLSAKNIHEQLYNLYNYTLVR